MKQALEPPFLFRFPARSQGASFPPPLPAIILCGAYFAFTILVFHLNTLLFEENHAQVGMESETLPIIIEHIFAP